MKNKIHYLLVPLCMTIVLIISASFLGSCEDSYGLDANIREKILKPDTIRDTIRETQIIYVRDTHKIGQILPDSVYVEFKEIPVFYNDSSKILRFEQISALVSAAIDTSDISSKKISLNLTINKTPDDKYQNDQLISIGLKLDKVPIDNDWFFPKKNAHFRLLQLRPNPLDVYIEGDKANARVFLQDIQLIYNNNIIDCYFDALIPTTVSGLEIRFRARVILFYNIK